MSLDKFIPELYPSVMKTAISIPQDVFENAEKYAAETGMSRSRFYTKAIQDYLQRQSDEAITVKLNEVYAREDSSLDPPLRKMQAETIRRHGR